MKILLIILFILASASTIFAQKATVNVDVAKLRSQPKEKSKAIAPLPKGMQISVIASEKGWLHVNTPRGAGWLPETSVIMEPKTETPKPSYSRSYAEQKPRIIYGRCKDDMSVYVDDKQNACKNNGGISIWYADTLAGYYFKGVASIALGLPINDFVAVCKFGHFSGDRTSTTDDVGAPQTTSFTLVRAEDRRDDCVGVFIFQYGQLARMDRTTVYK